jgi:hypothetical protein
VNEFAVIGSGSPDPAVFNNQKVEETFMNKHPAILAFLFAAALFCGEALAITLSLTPSSQMIVPALGEKAIVDLEISGLGEDGPPTLGAFGVEITFSPSILSFETVDYGTFLGDPNNPAETDVQTSVTSRII